MAGHQDDGSRFDAALFRERHALGGEGYLQLARTFLAYMAQESEAVSAFAVGISQGDAHPPSGCLDMACGVHGLAGSAATFGLSGLRLAALRLEQALRQGDPAPIRACCEELEIECGHADEFLRERLGTP